MNVRKKLTKYSGGGRNDGSKSGPFAMTKEEQDKSTAAVLKGDKEFMKDAKREERKTDRTIRRTGGGAEGLKKLQNRLRRKTKRQRRRENRREKVKKWMSTHTLNPIKAKNSRGRKKDSTGGQGKNAGCQGAGCGAYE